MSLRVAIANVRREAMEGCGKVKGICSRCGNQFTDRYCSVCDDIHEAGHGETCPSTRLLKDSCQELKGKEIVMAWEREHPFLARIARVLID